MSFYDNRYYYLNKRFLSIIGQWPFQSRLKNNLMFCIMVFFLFTLTALEFWGLVAGITDLSIIMENASPLLVNNFIIVKLVNCVCVNYKMKKLLEDVEETWKVKHEGPEKEILCCYAKECRIFSIRYATAIYAMWLFYTTTPVIISGIYIFLPTNETYSARFLYRIEHVIDIDKYFNLLMLHGFISVFYVVSVPIAVDTFFILCIQHVCALFKCIKYNIERIGNSEFVLLKPNIADDKAYHVVISCIKSYKHVLKFSDLLSSAYATSFLLMLGNVVICLTFSTAELVMVDNQIDEIIRILAATLAQLVHIYYLSLTSQRLIDHSSEFYDVIYGCNWYNISLRSRHLLRLTLLRATKPCQIKAGKLFIMSMETFSTFWGLVAGITDLSIIMENASPLLMKKLLEDVEETWKVKHKGPEKEILCCYAEECRIFSIQYATALYAMWLFYTTTPIVVSGICTLLPTNETYSARFLYRVEHVLDIDKYFNLLMLHVFISAFYIVSVPIAVDTFFILCIQHVCALFKCMKYNIERIGNSEFVLLKPNIADDKAYHVVISCIKSYKHVLNTAELVMVDNQIDEIIRILAATLAQLVHIYYLSLTSQRLIDHSSEFHDILGLVAAWQDWSLVIECSSPIIIHSLCIIKFANYFFNARKFNSLFIQMRDSWRLATFGAQIQILTAYTNEGKKMAKVYAVIIYGSTCLYMILPVTPSIVAILTNPNQTHIHGLLYHVEAVLDTKKYYYIILLHSYYATFFLMTIPVAADSMMIAYIQHACGLFQAIGYGSQRRESSSKFSDLMIFPRHQLENVKQNDDLKINIYPLYKDDEHYRIISDSVSKHKQVLQFAELLASSYSISFVALIVLNVAIMTFSGVQVVNNRNQPSEAFRFLLTGLCLSAHLLFLCLPGQKLIDHSFNMHKSIYAANWYAISLRARKSLNLMLIRCKTPCQLTAGKMSVMCLRSFSGDKELALLEENEKMYKNFVYCIQKHKHALWFAKCLEIVYTKAFFMEVGLIVLAMSLSALQATNNTLTPHLAIRHASYIIAQLLHLYIACWLGQQIIDHSDRVYTSIYRGEWYESSPKSRKLLNMIMLRSTLPCTLTVGKIMILSLPSFSAVVRVSASYFTVLQSVR
ncbi:uncharacterized protein LOC105431361 [Pogonomyrmex barbatus]|uniref:Uncharacterized protein LOC105431361 n=1 Tax=Pogonomyrmex barbatus TaxID=144034 RepID=A0A8N1SB12_9HYME|nr:uncharacterized protein LOC105431361 [Pogonomyrmex barbatus]